VKPKTDIRERTENEKREMAKHFAAYEPEYRDSEWANVIYEDDEVVLVEDTKSYEFNEWREEFGDGFSEVMHNLANQLVDRRWSHSYPLVFDKIEDGGDLE
jgi:hypothetical protein